MGAHLDDLMTRLGTSSWNIFHIASLSYWFCMTSFHTLGGVFFAPKVNFTCLPHPRHLQHNITLVESCSYMVETNTTEEEWPCTEWSFDNDTFSSTVTSEFSLVCEREYLRTAYQGIYMFGIFVAAPLNGLLADRYGRLPMVSFGTVLFTVVALGSCWLPDLWSLLVSRCVLGMMHPTSLQTGYILAMEVAEPKLRTALGVGLFLTWALGTVAWGGAGYLVRDWRWLQLFVSLPCLLFLPALWVLDESPRWLAVKGYHDRALRVLKKAARWNKVTLPPDERILDILKDDQIELNNGGVGVRSFKNMVMSALKTATILFRTPKLRIISLVMYLDYLVTGMVFFGLSLSGANFSADPFLYMSLTGLAEIPGNTVIIPFVARYGRRSLTVIFYFLSGVTLLALPFIPTRVGWLVVTLAMVGKMSITSVFNIVFLYASDLFPTEVRTRGMGTSLMMSRVGSMLCPFIVDYLGNVYSWGPSVVFGATSVVAGLATLVLPETLGTALPDTIATLEHQDRRKIIPNKIESEDEKSPCDTETCEMLPSQRL